MREICLKVVNLITENPARFSCPEVAKILNLSERQVRYALGLLKKEGYETGYVKKKLVLDKNQASMSSNYKEESIRQFHLLCWLSTYGMRGCEESILLSRMGTELGFHEQTIKRDLEDLLAEDYIVKEGRTIRLSERLVDPGFLNDHDLDRMINLIFSYGYRSENNDFLRSILYKLIMLKPAFHEYLASREKLVKRVYFLGGEAVEDEAVSPFLPVIRAALINGEWLRTVKGDIRPIKLQFSSQLGVWYLIGCKVPKTRLQKFRLSSLGKVSVIPAEYTISEVNNKKSKNVLIELEVYPDFSEQKKVLHQLAGLSSVQFFWTEDGILKVFMDGEHREDFIRWLRFFGPSIKVIRPDYLRSQLLNTADKVTRLYMVSGKRGAKND